MKPDPLNPQALQQGRAYDLRSRPAPTPPQEPGPQEPAPPAFPADALLLVRPDPLRACERVTLTKPLLGAIAHLKAGAPVDVVVPPRRGGAWFLDTRPTATRRVPGPTQKPRLRIPQVSREHYLIAGVAPHPDQAHPRTTGTSGYHELLCFRLGPERYERVCVPDAQGRPVCSWRPTGYFALLPAPPPVFRSAPR